MIIAYAKYYTMHTLSPLHREGGIEYFNNITRVAHRLIAIQSSSYGSQSCKQFMRSLYWSTEREINHIATRTTLSLEGELLPPHHVSSSVDGDGGGVGGEAFRGHFPVPAACRNRDSCPPDLGFTMAAALEGFSYRGFSVSMF